MSIEQHAEAAADEIDRSMTDGPKSIISKHMTAAIDEAVAEKMISALDAASNHAHEVDLLRARIAELEGLGPLIAEYSWAARDRSKAGQSEAKSLSDQMKAILKGGGS